MVSTYVGRVYTYIHSLSWATVEDDDDAAMCQLANQTNPYEIWEVSTKCVYPRYAEESQCLSQTIDAKFFYSTAPYRRRNWAPARAKACLPCQRLIHSTSYLAFSLIFVFLTLFRRCHDGTCISWADHRSSQCAALVAARSLATNGTRILPC